MRNKKVRQRKRPQARPQVSSVFVENEPEVRNRARSSSGIAKYFAHHAWVARTSLVRLLLTPLSTMMTAAVIAIALSLPAGLYILLNDLQSVVEGWQGSAQVSVFLKKNVSNQDSLSVQRAVKKWKEVAEVQLISADDALKEFQQQSGFGDALAILDENPLPAVLVVKPGTDFLSTEKLKPLADRLGQLPEVDLVQLDFQWIERLNQIIALGKRGALLLSVLLAIAVLLVIGNTIRLTIFNRREEILVTKLIGATNQFIRRPFLYTGFWYGVFGAVVSILLISVLFFLIDGPISELARLYNSPFRLSGMGSTDALVVFSCAIALGLVGSWIAVTRHIRTIEPE
ncbi:permease-like cell division protein FtsX [Kaarinaea lacus]